FFFFFFSSRRRHTRSKRDWSSDVCSSDLDHVDAPAVATDCGDALHVPGAGAATGDPADPRGPAGHAPAATDHDSRHAAPATGDRHSALHVASDRSGEDLAEADRDAARHGPTEAAQHGSRHAAGAAEDGYRAVLPTGDSRTEGAAEAAQHPNWDGPTEAAQHPDR